MTDAADVTRERMARIQTLYRMTVDIVSNSTHEDAVDFDVFGWLGRWLMASHPALGGAAPWELIDTDEGFESVKRALGAIESGVYL